MLYREEIAKKLDLDINEIPNLTGHRFSSSFKTINFDNINFKSKEIEYSIESPQIWISHFSRIKFFKRFFGFPWLGF